MSSAEPKPHICPPSNAVHPSDRWESLFIYSFLCKFTNLRGKEGLETPMDLEEALMSKEPHPILTQLLTTFVLNLKPQTRNLSADQISTTVASVLSEFLKTNERTVFWDNDLHRNVDPFEGRQSGFFSADWDFKLKVLRVLVELQLTHAPSIKATIDRAWGIVHNKHKKGQATEPKPEPSDPKSQENLQLLPVGQDSSRKRYWIADDSPRVWASTNPWKVTATFQSVSSDRDSYLALIEELKKAAPPVPKKGLKLSKLEQSHNNLIATLEGRIEAIDAELTRVAKVRRKMEQKRILLAQAELRETRTRTRTKRPVYTYDNDFDSEDEGDEYRYQDDMEEDSFSGGSRRRRQAATTATRRSSRVTKSSYRDHSPADSWQNWRGERRSTRSGGSQFDDDRAPKRAKTEESTVSTEGSTSGVASSGLKIKNSGAAALKPTEMAVEQIPGKKRSKFWVYAVEPIPGEGEDSSPGGPVDTIMSGDDAPSTHASKNGAVNSASTTAVDEAEWTQSNGRSKSEMSYDASMDGSLSPMAVDDS
ncbi:hypothetical protein CC1G_01836 [Coprinopsis cinerea okayama7|uniref:WHIM1 domain-containing protein n=1 Tax=Coprinopsis cinerea (strain Okayama-7 / 130 / ATCC MYA-4618 / FGSC 9003) TaxID=240176 RepID=A8N2T4_COPC7|nr:hypothetical protein CC1G_01836 [Coprinopsis cinerea okayama7\|eukprot:XP_001829156.1 hypothetical protein CC1G_01836 [Coprinopsis cinerea okayama7\